MSGIDGRGSDLTCRTNFKPNVSLLQGEKRKLALTKQTCFTIPLTDDCMYVQFHW